MQNPVYFDHNATTPLLPKTSEQLVKIIEEGFGNASSVHWAGRRPKQILRETRQKLAQYLGCHPSELVFTSGASESNNTVIRTLIELKETHPELVGKNIIVTSNVEHPSIQSVLSYYHQLGTIQWVTFDVTKSGIIDVKLFDSLLSEKVLLVSIMGANNETGLIFPIQDLAQLAKQRGILFHSDMTQVFGKMPIVLSNLDYLSISAHKAYALKGCGVLWIRKGSPFIPLIRGGAQERYRRSGTENILAIASMGMSLDYFANIGGFTHGLLRPMQEYFEMTVLNKIERVTITHDQVFRLPNTSHLIIEGVDGESLLMNLDLKGYAVSTGAACSSGSPEPSPVLLSLGFSAEEAQMSLRVSFGVTNTLDQIDQFISDLTVTVQYLRQVKESPCVY